MSEFSVCVFCGSRDGKNSAYREAANTLGTTIAQQNWRLVYGAGDIGLMGAVANATQRAGGKTFGVIPVHLMQAEVGKRDLSHFIVTENMHERKKVMFMNSDAIVVLPGGAGSLDEFFEVLTWAQLDLHQKPIYLLNIEGYWQPLVDLIEHVIEQGFAAPTLRALYTVLDSTDQLATALREASERR